MLSFGCWYDPIIIKTIIRPLVCVTYNVFGVCLYLKNKTIFQINSNKLFTKKHVEH